MRHEGVESTSRGPPHAEDAFHDSSIRMKHSLLYYESALLIVVLLHQLLEVPDHSFK